MEPTRPPLEYLRMCQETPEIAAEYIDELRTSLRDTLLFIKDLSADTEIGSIEGVHRLWKEHGFAEPC
jgi:hypothetical protein